MKFVLIILFCSIAMGGFAQLLDNRKCSVFSEDPFFDQNFLRTNKVKTIHGKLSTKKEMDIIRSRHFTEFYYEFDSLGKQVKQYTTFRKNVSTKDTTVITYLYNNQGYITTKRRNDNYGFYSYNYELDTSGNILKSSYCRDENIGPSKNEFKLGKQFIIVDESFSYQKINDIQFKKKFYNNYGKAYQEEISYFNEMGYLTEVETRLIVNSKRSKITYEYDEKGRVSKKIDYSSLGGKNELMSTYRYDEIGNLLEINTYRNGEHKEKTEILYDGRMLMEAKLTMDMSTKVISIIKYEYTFYE